MTYVDGYGYTINTVGMDFNQVAFFMSVGDFTNIILTDDVKPSVQGERRGGARGSATLRFRANRKLLEPA